MFSSAALFPSVEPATATGSSPQREAVVLLVEDEDSLAELLKHLLARIKVRVLHAADGAQALQLLQLHRASISMAFVDCHLPDMMGAELCRELRASMPGLPLLLTSGRDQRAVQTVYAAGGPCAFLPKPYMPADVTRHVTALMSAVS